MVSISPLFMFCNQRIEGETKTAKSWRHPLSKPPARSPMTLVKQQATSDEGELGFFFPVFIPYKLYNQNLFLSVCCNKLF